MSRLSRTYTVDEELQYLDDNFNIPEDGLHSDLVDSQDEDFDEMGQQQQQNIYREDVEEDINLAHVDIAVCDDEEMAEERPIGRPSNIQIDQYVRSNTYTANIAIPAFTKSFGPTQAMPQDSKAVDFVLLLVSNRMLANIVRETNQKANRDPDNWNEVTLEELKAYLGLLIATSFFLLPS